MSITDELREYATVSWNPWPAAKDWLLQMCDRIDAEHQKAIRELNNLADSSVILPVDADGEYIHMGDRMENGELVVRIVLTDGSWEPTVYTAATPNQLHEYYCHNIRHYHGPTVEDVLRQFLNECDSAMTLGYDEVPHEVFTKYAARLRLADDSREQ